MKVYLSTKNIGQTHVKQPVEKLRARFLGPYVVKAKKSEYTYELSLPQSMKRLHPVFHVSLLWKAVPTPEQLANRFLDENIQEEEAVSNEPGTATTANTDVAPNTTAPLLDAEGQPVFRD